MMKAIIVVVGLFAFAPAFAAERSCSGGLGGECVDVGAELAAVRKYFAREDHRLLLVATQALLSTPPDGKWGPITAKAFQSDLEVYAAIMQGPSGWGHSGFDVEKYLSWVASAHYAQDAGAEFPD